MAGYSNLDELGVGINSGSREVVTAAYDTEADIKQLRVTRTAISAVTIRLMSAHIAAEYEWEIIDEGLNAHTNNITITTEGAELIMGAADAKIDGDGDSLSLYSAGGNVFIGHRR